MKSACAALLKPWTFFRILSGDQLNHLTFVGSLNDGKSFAPADSITDKVADRIVMMTVRMIGMTGNRTINRANLNKK